MRPFALALTMILSVPASSNAEPGSRLGQIEFPTSGAAEAQEPFLRGVLLLHSFEYEDAREAFEEAREIDPGFVMAHWGVAMTHNRPLWNQQDREAARAVLGLLGSTPAERRAKASTEREKGYLAAIETLYGEGAKRDRDLAYSKAMRELHELHPEDLEAAAFHALSILGTVRERDFRTYMRAAAVAEEVFAANPLHPGAAHYLIHSYDDPVHAPLGLRAARAYAEIAPAATHAQHMISHIYTALGRWDEVVEANRKAVEVSEARLRARDLPLSGRTKHSLLWLEYGLLQQGRFLEAGKAMRTMAADAAEDPSVMHLWHYAQMRAAYVVMNPSRGDAPPPIALEGVTADGVAADAFATGWRALHLGRRDEARGALETIRRVVEEVEPGGDEGGNVYDGVDDEVSLEVAAILALELEGALAVAEGDVQGGLALLERAAEAEEARALEYGPPSVVKPSHELLGEILLSLGRPAEARARFETALERAPRRTLSLLGLERAARALGDEAAAAQAAAELTEIWDGDREALRSLGRHDLMEEDGE